MNAHGRGAVAYLNVSAVRAAVVFVVLVSGATACQRNKAADVRAELLSGYGAGVSDWSDARMDRFGHKVCKQLDQNLAPTNPADPPRWMHFYSPGVLALFHDAYCS